MGAEWAGEAYLQQQCLLKNILLEYGCFTMLCVSTVQQNESAINIHISETLKKKNMQESVTKNIMELDA